MSNNDIVELREPETVTQKEAVDYFMQKMGFESLSQMAQKMSIPNHKLQNVYDHKWSVDSEIGHSLAFYTFKSKSWWQRLKR